jgi:hypothetical protein
MKDKKEKKNGNLTGFLFEFFSLIRVIRVIRGLFSFLSRVSSAGCRWTAG